MSPLTTCGRYAALVVVAFATQEAALRVILETLGIPAREASIQARHPCPNNLGRARLVCDSQDRVINFRLQHAGVQGQIPRELGQLEELEVLLLDGNQLTGEIPAELGQLRNLSWLYLSQNQLTGEIPPELGQLQKLTRLGLQNNKLTGKIPTELGQLRSLRWCHLSDNQIMGEIPRELGQLEDLSWLYMSQNQLTSRIPRQLGQLQDLKALSLSQNQLTGEIPRELGALYNLEELVLSQNQLVGDVPRELGQLSLESLDLSWNQLSGEVPHEVCHMQELRELLLQHNQLQKFPAVLKMPALKVLDASSNAFRDELSVQFLTNRLERLDLSHNEIAGGISSITDFFCRMTPTGGVLQELRLNHNRFSGELPPCLMQFESLTFLALNNNRFRGSLPEISASRLSVLSLHKNALTGVLPESLRNLSRLSVLTLHDNAVRGRIGSLKLKFACWDNSRFRLEGYHYNCKNVPDRNWWTDEERQQLEANCPQKMQTCHLNDFVKLTLHHNRFSCAVPEFISNSTVLSLVIMGNMLGDGTPLASSWISEEELQPFLYYSPNVQKSHALVLAGLLLTLTIGATFCGRQLRARLSEASGRLDGTSGARVVSSSLALIRSAFIAFLLSSPLLLIFGISGKYYDCSPLLFQTTIADLQGERPWPDLGVIASWCALQLFFRSILAGIPVARESQQVDLHFGWRERVQRVGAWILWICIVSFLSLPSISFAFAQSLPAQNTWDLNDDMLKFIHRTAPVQTVLIDMVLAARISKKFSDLTGVKADRLLMMFRLFSAWLLALLTTVVLDENCHGGWKLAWKVCQAGSDEHSKFNWKIFDEEILNTQRDICDFSGTFWSDGRCSRAIVGGLSPFLLKKLLTRSTLQPFMLLASWRLSRLEPESDPRDGRHRRLFGVWPKTTKSLMPLQQMALLTTQMELLMFWSPFVPLLCVGILVAAAMNLLIFDLGMDFYGVCLPSIGTDGGASAFSVSYLSLTLGFGSLFQLWHAFSTEMTGRYVLLAFTLAVMGPWAPRFLPVAAVKRRVWARSDAREAEQVEAVEMMGVEERAG